MVATGYWSGRFNESHSPLLIIFPTGFQNAGLNLGNWSWLLTRLVAKRARVQQPNPQGSISSCCITTKEIEQNINCLTGEKQLDTDNWGITTTTTTIARNQALHWGKKEKKNRRGRNKKSARKAILFYPTFAFSPHCKAWPPKLSPPSPTPPPTP